MVRFDASLPGTAASAWDDVIGTAGEIDLDPSTLPAVIVVGAHPDDETLGAGGLVARLAAHGVPTTVVVVTNGAASRAGDDAAARGGLVEIRAEELGRAMGILAPLAQVIAMGFEDGTTRERRGDIRDRMSPLFASAAPGTLVIAPWAGDGHRDHRVVGEICEELAEESDVTLLPYPVWFWHWGDPSAGLGAMEELRTIPLTEDELALKVAALAQYRSQIDGDLGVEPVLRSDVIPHFTRSAEAFVVPRGGDRRDRHFERLHHFDPDPWAVATSWYERRKRAVMLAALPEERCGSALELGASAGHFTLDLARRSDHVVAVDLSPSAVARAAERTRTCGNVDVEVRDIRDGLPDGRFDLVVVSEFGYYLTHEQLHRLVARIERSLTSTGVVLACHWRGYSDDMHQTGADVHEALANRFRTRVDHEDEEFLVGVFSRRQ